MDQARQPISDQGIDADLLAAVTLAFDLIAHGVPVVVCQPRQGWQPGDKRSDVIPPAGWATITAAESLPPLDAFRPGVDALAMVGGHGIDVVDVDTKDDGSVGNLPAFRSFGIHTTPSSGRHYLVRSTGIGKISPLTTSAGHVGDYVGGTPDGGSRMLAFLPGSTRPKYPRAGYGIEQRVDLDELFDCDPDDDLIGALLHAGGNRDGLPGVGAASYTEARAFLAEHDGPDPGCTYGRKVVGELLAEANAAVPGSPTLGRHAWAMRSVTRVVELIRAGCAVAADVRAIAGTLEEIKPEGGDDVLGMAAWALTNADGGSACHQHASALVDTSQDGATGATPATAATSATTRDTGQSADQGCNGCSGCHGSAGGAPQGAEIADAALNFLTGYVAFPSEHAAVTATLWTLHTHALPAFDTTPRLAALSPEPASGKTRLLEVVGMLAANALHTTNSSVAAIFRKIEMDRPTLLFDEVDAIFGRYGKDEDNESLRGLLNSGHAKGTPVFRCVTEGKTIVVKDFDVFAPVALAGLGNLPETLMTRSVVIRMRKRRPTERLEPYRRRKVEPEGHRLRAHLATWGASVVDSLANAWPEMPAGVEDRAADCWEPLLAVADVLGGTWPELARDACEALIKATTTDAAPSLRVRLLRDLHLVFGDHLAMWTGDILTELHALDESPWQSLGGEPLSSLRLAGLLREHGIRSQDVRFADVVRKGYRRSDLWEAWERYCPDLLGATPRNPATGATAATSQVSASTSVAPPDQHPRQTPLPTLEDDAR